MTPKVAGYIAHGGGILGGFLLGVAATMEWAEFRALKKYEESAASMRRAYELALTDQLGLDKKFEVQKPVASEELLEEVDANFVPPLPSEMEAYAEETNPYHTAVMATETSTEMFVSGGINDYGISYIEDEEYEDDGDGRHKEQVIFVLDNEHPHFYMNGAEIDDWDEKLGQSIVVDFLKHTPPGREQVMYVRNHKTGEDYEVIRELP